MLGFHNNTCTHCVDDRDYVFSLFTAGRAYMVQSVNHSHGDHCTGVYSTIYHVTIIIMNNIKSIPMKKKAELNVKFVRAGFIFYVLV